MKKNSYTLYIGFIIVLIVVFSVAIYYIKTGSKEGGAELNLFAQCLKEKNITMYGAEWCQFCQKEKAAFGSSFQYVSYVECPQNIEQCNALGIEGFPTWIFPDSSTSSPQAGKKLVGYQGLEKLSVESGCILPAKK